MLTSPPCRSQQTVKRRTSFLKRIRRYEQITPHLTLVNVFVHRTFILVQREHSHGLPLFSEAKENEYQRLKKNHGTLTQKYTFNRMLGLTGVFVQNGIKELSSLQFKGSTTLFFFVITWRDKKILNLRMLYRLVVAQCGMLQLMPLTFCNPLIWGMENYSKGREKKSSSDGQTIMRTLRTGIGKLYLLLQRR